MSDCDPCGCEMEVHSGTAPVAEVDGVDSIGLCAGILYLGSLCLLFLGSLFHPGSRGLRHPGLVDSGRKQLD